MTQFKLYTKCTIKSMYVWLCSIMSHINTHNNAHTHTHRGGSRVLRQRRRKRLCAHSTYPEREVPRSRGPDRVSRSSRIVTGVRDQFRIGGWGQLPEYFLHCLPKNQVVLPEYYTFCPKMAIWKISGGLQLQPPPPPPRLVSPWEF